MSLTPQVAAEQATSKDAAAPPSASKAAAEGRPEKPPAPSSGAKSQVRVQRPPRVRNRNRNHGPPGFQFIIAGDPSEFKDEKTKRSVRSQAMMQYRYKARADGNKVQKSTKPRPLRDVVEGSHKGKGAAVVGVGVVPSKSLDSPAPTWYLAPTTDADKAPDQPWDNAVAVPRGPSQRYFRVLLELSQRSAAFAAGKKVNAYDWGSSEQDRFMDLLMSKVAASSLPPVGNPGDPFGVLPKFSTKELNDTRGTLVRESLRSFVSSATMEKWFPAMIVHEHILLSATTIVSTWVDMHNRIPGDSTRTILVKGEIIGWINGRLSDPVQQYEDATLMLILHLLAGELWTCNEPTIRIHEQGVVRLITHRGGMQNLGGNGATADVAAACCLHSDILCEADMLPMFASWEPARLGPMTKTVAMPESPLLCPRAELFTLAIDPNCSPYTYEILCDMRDLTNLFIARHRGLDAVPDMHHDLVPYVTSTARYKAKLSEMRTRLVSFPSAHAGQPGTANDFIYESCRIAALLYMSAILERVPFSHAALPGNAILLSELGPSAMLTQNGRPLDTRHFSDVLYETLKQTDLFQVWGEMSGVLYWATLVGAAAARSVAPFSPVHTQSIPNPPDSAVATWVRRCLVMYTTRTMLIMIFQHPLPIILAQRKLLVLQELLDGVSSDAAARPVVIRRRPL